MIYKENLGLLAAKTSPTPAEKWICSQIVDHLGQLS